LRAARPLLCHASMRRAMVLLAVCLVSGGALLAWAQKKGGEKCTSDSDCETKKCNSGTCDPCPDRNNCPPPGTCSASDQESLQRNKNDTCNKERSCTKIADFNDNEVSFDALNERLKINNACINARTELMDKCFKGGDDAHVNERRNVVEVRDKCTSLIDYKKGKSLAFFGSQSDYDSYERSIDSACRSKDDYTCSESQNDEKIDCSKVESRISAGEKCVKAREDIVYRMFDNRSNYIRLNRKQETEAAISKCKDLLKFKKDKSLCK
jgi:hypothetical protein